MFAMMESLLNMSFQLLLHCVKLLLQDHKEELVNYCATAIDNVCKIL